MYDNFPSLLGIYVPHGCHYEKRCFRFIHAIMPLGFHKFSLPMEENLDCQGLLQAGILCMARAPGKFLTVDNLHNSQEAFVDS